MTRKNVGLAVVCRNTGCFMSSKYHDWLAVVVMSISVGACAIEGSDDDVQADRATRAQSLLSKVDSPFTDATRMSPMMVHRVLPELDALSVNVNGPFQIKPRTGPKNDFLKCLDVTGGPTATGNGVPVQQWDCLPSHPHNQLWFFVDAGNNFETAYVLALHSHKCLDVVGGPGATANGTPLQQWDCLGFGQTNQRWITQGNGNITAVHSGKCLDVRDASSMNGAGIQQWDCFSPPMANQVWSLVYVSM
jgi:hypothetical protein